MSNPMTPTEQDKELFENSFGEWLENHGVELSSNNPSHLGTWQAMVDMNELKLAIMQLITADRKRVALEAFDEGYEAGRKEKPPKLVDAVEFRRESYGWSKGKMAAMLDMTKGNYSEFIHGRRGLPLNSIRKAYAIGIPAQVLLQDDIDRQLKAQQEEV